MPELPEVEVVKNFLKSTILRKKILEIRIVNKNLRYHIPNNLSKTFSHTIITKISRRGKYLILFFSNDFCLLVHLGMTGYFRIKEKEEIIKHDHLFIYFRDKYLIYNDIRKFGFVKMFKSKLIFNSLHLKKLGVEPLSDNLDYKYFKQNSNKTIDIKTLLMDQSFIAGLGNIYCSEILYSSRIKPTRLSKTINDYEIKRLIISIKKILKQSILRGGTTIKNFIVSDEKIGYFKNELKVYGRLGCECLRCGDSNYVEKIIQKGRSTFFCSKCQV
tara:strand:+ start:1628 stop:2446 length:819 start_codon:yes stop_codon:yes gene_type:complete